MSHRPLVPTRTYATITTKQYEQHVTLREKAISKQLQEREIEADSYHNNEENDVDIYITIEQHEHKNKNIEKKQ